MIIDCVGAAERWWECMCTNFHMCVCANVFLRVCVCQRVGCAFERVACMCAKYNENYTQTPLHFSPVPLLINTNTQPEALDCLLWRLFAGNCA